MFSDINFYLISKIFYRINLHIQSKWMKYGTENLRVWSLLRSIFVNDFKDFKLFYWHCNLYLLLIYCYLKIQHHYWQHSSFLYQNIFEDVNWIFLLSTNSKTTRIYLHIAISITDILSLTAFNKTFFKRALFFFKKFVGLYPVDTQRRFNVYKTSTRR